VRAEEVAARLRALEQLEAAVARLEAEYPSPKGRMIALELADMRAMLEGAPADEPSQGDDPVPGRRLVLIHRSPR
jgi:hypothetical protein